MCTILVVHLIAISVIVALTKNKGASKVLHILPFRPTRLHCIKERIKKKKKEKLHLTSISKFLQLSKGRKKKSMRQHNVPLALASKNNFLELKMRISKYSFKPSDQVRKTKQNQKKKKKKTVNRFFQEVKLGKIIYYISSAFFCVTCHGDQKYTLSPRTPCSC